METVQKFLSGYYRDSVALMYLSSKMAEQNGIISASAQMATAANIELMVDTGLLEQTLTPRPNDLLIVVQAQTSAQGEAAVASAKAALDEKKSGRGEASKREPPRSIEMAMAEEPESNVVLISTPGEFAGAEALKALKQGLSVLMFSDNVPLAQEVLLKTYARDHDLLVMGPDCGTSIIGGVPLAFANVVAPGGIGVIGASGTGIQQVTCLVDRLGEGISHAIGTGGHDLSQEVGGLTMLSALEMLAQDVNTLVIVLLSKPAAEAVAIKIIAAAKAVSKQIVICFLGSAPKVPEGNLVYAQTLEEAAALAVGLLDPSRKPILTGRIERDKARLGTSKAKVSKGTFVRGLYTGGTFCYEAQVLLQKVLGEVYSNTPANGVKKLPDLWKSQGHTIIDLGDDDFTRGRPHPMIDPSIRNERILKEAQDPDTGIILLDVVLGYGAHDNPAAGLVQVIGEANAAAKNGGRELVFVGFLCGTDKDPQNFAQQAKLLENAGVVIAESNAHAAEIIQYLVSGRPS
jgi:succinyl-CoA synthetase alpha subunit